MNYILGEHSINVLNAQESHKRIEDPESEIMETSSPLLSSPCLSFHFHSSPFISLSFHFHSSPFPSSIPLPLFPFHYHSILFISSLLYSYISFALLCLAFCFALLSFALLCFAGLLPSSLHLSTISSYLTTSLFLTFGTCPLLPCRLFSSNLIISISILFPSFLPSLHSFLYSSQFPSPNLLITSSPFISFPLLSLPLLSSSFISLPLPLYSSYRKLTLDTPVLLTFLIQRKEDSCFLTNEHCSKV